MYLVDLFGPWIQTAPSSSSRWERTAQKKVMEPTLNTPSVQLVVMVFLTNVRKWKWLPTFFGAQSNIGRLRFSRMWKLGFLGGSRSLSGVLGLVDAKEKIKNRNPAEPGFVLRLAIVLHPCFPLLKDFSKCSSLRSACFLIRIVQKEEKEKEEESRCQSLLKGWRTPIRHHCQQSSLASVSGQFFNVSSYMASPELPFLLWTSGLRWVANNEKVMSPKLLCVGFLPARRCLPPIQHES